MFTSSCLFFLSLIALAFFLPRVFKNPQLGVLLLIFLLPFERIPSWDIPWQWGITIRLSQAVVLVLILAFLYQWAKKQITWEKVKGYLENPVILSVVAYLIIGLISVIWAIDREKSWLVFGFTLFTALTGFLVYFYLDDRKMLPKIEKILFYSVVVVSIFAIYQFLADSISLAPFWTGLKDRYLKEILGFPRVQSFALEPLFLANYLLIPLGFFASLYLTKKSQLSEKRLVLALILIVVTIFLTVSRGGCGAAIVLLVLVAIFLRKTYSYQRFLKLLGLVLAGLALATGLIFSSSYLAFGNSSGAVNLFAHSGQVATDQGERLTSREGTWTWAWQAFREKPVTGVGIGNFGAWMETQGYPGQQRVVNNEPLEILAETGILGAIPIVLMIFFLTVQTVKAWPRARELVAWLAAGLAIFWALWFQYLTFSTLYITHFWVLIGLLLAIRRITLQNVNDT